MKMKSKNDSTKINQTGKNQSLITEKDKIKKINSIAISDIVLIKTSLDPAGKKYLVVNLNKRKRALEVLPLDPYCNQQNVFVPYLSYPYSMINDLEKLDKTMLLFLMNHDNPHITSAIENMK
jgi:hypothetical protein